MQRDIELVPVRDDIGTVSVPTNTPSTRALDRENVRKRFSFILCLVVIVSAAVFLLAGKSRGMAKGHAGADVDIVDARYYPKRSDTHLGNAEHWAQATNICTARVSEDACEVMGSSGTP